MSLLDRLRGRGPGVPGRAVVVVNRSPGPETGKSSVRTLLKAHLRPLPEGSGPEGDVSHAVASHHAHLVTAGMEVPALLDPDSRQPLRVLADGLDEAIGRHYLALEPEHATWEAALAAKRKQLRRDTGVFGDVRHGFDQLRGVKDAAAALPGGLRGAAKDWKAALAGMGEDAHPAGEPVEGVSFEAWVEVRVGLSREGTDTDEAAYAESHGIPAGRWAVVNSTWEQRVHWNQHARALYDKALADAK